MRLSEIILSERYLQQGETTWEDVSKRMSRAIALAESPEKYDEWYTKFYNELINFNFIPGGRIITNAGKSKPYLLNCVSGDTLIHTKEGVFEASSLIDKEISVLSIGGKFRQSKWSCFGEQMLYNITLQNGDVLKATAEHEWIVQGTKKVHKTYELIGKRIPTQSISDFEYLESDYNEGVRHGIVFGDGTRHTPKSWNGDYCDVVLFNGKTHLMYDFFESPSIRKVKGFEIGEAVGKCGLPGAWKELPSLSKSRSYLRGFIAGLIATDGTVDKIGNVLLNNKNSDVLMSIRKIAYFSGIITTNVRLFRTINPFTKEDGFPCFGLGFLKSSMYDNKMIIKKSHREKMFASVKPKKSYNVKVVSVEPYQIEKVYCCVEPETHTMVIDSGYLTKQCNIISVEDSRESIGEMLKEILMISGTGGGVGLSFSKLRPKGIAITTNGGFSSGPISFMGCADVVAGTIKTGGGRRAALMISLSVYHPDIEEFLHVKLDLGQLNNANVSVEIDNKFIQAVRDDANWDLIWAGKVMKTVKAKDIWDKIITNAHKCGEPGIMNLGYMNEMSNSWYYSKIESTNPCIVGDTLIAVADGRNAVSIKTLTEEKKDVAVYSTNIQTGKTEIKWGRNPRKTGEKREVYELVLDDDSILRATPDHKILMLNGEYKELKDLLIGESITPFYSFDSNKYRQIYKSGAEMIGGHRRNRRQYRLVYEFFKGEIDYEYAIHHSDFNSKNDSPDNLVAMLKDEHTKFHSVRMLGEKNPYHKMTESWKTHFATHNGETNGRYTGHTNEQILEHGKKLFKMLGRIQKRDWVKYAKQFGLPQHLANEFRFGSFTNFANQCSENHKVKSVKFCGYEDVYNITVDDNHNYHVITSGIGDYTVSSGICVKNCGEIPGPAYASCDLGSINVSNFVKNKKFDRKAFEQTVEVGVRFLDNVLQVNEYPLSKLKEVGTSDRRIGLGLCGLHYGMVKMGIKYSSEAGVEFAEMIYEILRNHSYYYSTELAVEKGSFQKFDPEKFLKSAFVKTLPTKIREKIRKDGIRNVCLNTQAPTGTTSILADVSSGIEPIYAPVYERTFFSGDDKKKEIIADNLFQKMTESGEDISAFEGALDITPEQHIAIQEAAQRYLDQAVSKCMASDTTMVIVDDEVLYLDEISTGVPDTFCKYTGKTKNHRNQEVNIRNIYNNGIAEIIRVTFSDGSFVECTPNHRIHTADGWKKARYINIDETISIGE